MPTTHAIILASGTGARLGDALPKQFIKVAGKTILEHTIEVFESHPGIDDIHIVIHADFRSLAQEILLKNGYTKVRRLLNGGKTRQESSGIGLSKRTKLEVLHGVARLSQDQFQRRPCHPKTQIEDDVGRFEKEGEVVNCHWQANLPEADTVYMRSQKNLPKP